MRSPIFFVSVMTSYNFVRCISDEMCWDLETSYLFVYFGSRLRLKRSRQVLWWPTGPLWHWIVNTSTVLLVQQMNESNLRVYLQMKYINMGRPLCWYSCFYYGCRRDHKKVFFNEESGPVHRLLLISRHTKCPYTYVFFFVKWVRALEPKDLSEPFVCRLRLSRALPTGGCRWFFWWFFVPLMILHRQTVWRLILFG